MNKLEIKAPAKINIGLNIISKRPDGYHNIETVFYPINLFDSLMFDSSDHFSFICSNVEVTNSKNNSILKAVEILEEHTGKKLDVEIKLNKRIPIGAGMGGGSSNAAAALLSLNKFFKLGLSEGKLMELALDIGSDVPFFLKPYPSFAELRGEKLKPIKLNIPYPILIVNPGIHVSTKWAYENIRSHTNETKLNKVLDKEVVEFSKLKDFVVNDFEETVFQKYPEIKDLKEYLYKSGALFALMTGSGSTVFGIFNNLALIKKTIMGLPSGYFYFVQDRNNQLS